MAYDRVNWEDAPSTKTPISAENLNKMDAGIFENDKKMRKAISIKQEVGAEDIDSTLIESLPAATAAEDTDILIIENATKTQKITWGTILNLIKAKLGIGTVANLQTTSKEIVGAVNELNSKRGTISSGSLNDVVQEGTYWCNFANITDAPWNSGYGILEVARNGSSSSSVKLQRITRFVSSNISSFSVAVRSFANSQWYPWYSVTFTKIE